MKRVICDAFHLPVLGGGASGAGAARPAASVWAAKVISSRSENGVTWRVTVEPDGTPVAEYLRRQGRFRHFGEEEVRGVQEQVDARWALIQRRVAGG